MSSMTDTNAQTIKPKGNRYNASEALKHYLRLVTCISMFRLLGWKY